MAAPHIAGVAGYLAEQQRDQQRSGGSETPATKPQYLRVRHGVSVITIFDGTVITLFDGA